MSDREWQDNVVQRNIANTYAWTADNGFLSEEHSFSSSRSESLGGSYDFTRAEGIHVETKLAIMSVGFYGESDAILSGHLKISTTKSQDSSEDFGLSVNVGGEGFISAQAKPLPAPFTISANSFDLTTLNNGDLPDSINTAIRNNMSIDIDADYQYVVREYYANIQWKLIVDAQDRSDSYSFILSVDNNILTIAPVKNGLYPIDYEKDALPGKVKGYRFMSYYLEPDKDAFDTFFSHVVDPDWLASADPDAIALRQSQDNPNDVWRCLHRVTYVNRVPPVPGEGNSVEDAEDIANDVARPDTLSIKDNGMLINYLQGHDIFTDQRVDQQKLAEAIQGLLDSVLPTMENTVDAEAQITTLVTQYIEAYYAPESLPEGETL